MECRRGSIYGGVGYVKETVSAEPDPAKLKVRQRETVGIRMMASAGAIALGAFLMFAGRTRTRRKVGAT